VLLDQVVKILEDDEENEAELVESLKEDYIIRAKTVAYILDSKPEAEYDIDELQKIAGLMQIDEIHLFDETGRIYSGSEPKYYGFNFDSGEQISYFKPMLEDKSLTMCQDVTPNTAEGKSMMYAITWNETGDKMIQVGIEPLRLLEELRSNEISEVIADMPAYEGINIMVSDAETGEIYGATDGSLVGRTLDEIGIGETNTEQGEVASGVPQIDGYRNYCSYTRTGDYIVVVACSADVNIRNTMAAVAIEFVYLLLAGAAIVYMIKRVFVSDDEKSTQSAILETVADIYNSMHLIDIENNTFMEYSAREELSEVSKSLNNADETIEQLMTMTTEEGYLDDALAFTDISTLAKRMKDRKVISEEFVSKTIGWYRASFITAEADDEGYPTKVIYVTQNIDKMKKKEEELIYKSNVDELTGLYNRHAYEDDITKHGDLANEDNFVFVSLDVNGLKTVNDTLGHSAGDELITGAAYCMKRCFAPYGRVYRVGGDEFAAIISVNEKQLGDVKRVFEEVTSRWSGKQVKGLSVSYGYVTKREMGETTIHEMANIADKRMYDMKKSYYEKEQKESRIAGSFSKSVQVS
jgi:diguanylate cyclase (GGDEF)-like protein